MNNGLQVDLDFKYETGFSVAARFSAEAADLTALTGPSGSGKSTLLKLIAGLMTPQRGLITSAGRTLLSSDDSINVEPWNRNFGMLFQQDTLFPHLTVQKNLLYGARQRSAESPWQLASIVDSFQIGDLLARMPGELSGGQRDRVALGRTLLSNPAVLLLDEPLGSVEDSLRDSIFGLVREGVAEAGIPALLVTHDSSLLSSIAVNALEMSRGSVVVNFSG